MKWDKIVDESRPKVRVAEVQVVFSFETNLMGEGGKRIFMGDALGYRLSDEEMGKLFGVFPELGLDARGDAESIYEKAMRDLRKEHASYLEKWRDITAKRKATMSSKGKTHGNKVG
jgi:hypothetical protein